MKNVYVFYFFYFIFFQSIMDLCHQNVCFLSLGIGIYIGILHTSQIFLVVRQGPNLQ